MKNAIVILFLMLTLMGCKREKEETELTNDAIKEENIYVEGREEKNNIIEFVDKALKEQGNLGVYGDLSSGLKELTQECNIKIIEKDNFYEISLAPIHGDGGHGFFFKIDKKTGGLTDVVVGEIESEPEDE